MTFFVLASVRKTSPTQPRIPEDSRRIWLESWDGRESILIAQGYGRQPWHLQKGAQGLRVAPVDTFRAALPGPAAGSVVEGVTWPERPVLLPLHINTSSQEEQWERVQELRDLVVPDDRLTEDGMFRLVCSSASGTRQLGLVYVTGLEGEELYTTRVDRMAISAVAPQPFAEDRQESAVSFRAPAALDPFLSTAGTDLPWGTRKIYPSTTLSAATPVEIGSSVPVWPTYTITGPTDSVLITSTGGLRIDAPAGLGSGEVLTVVSDPRRKSITLDSGSGPVAAAGRLARGSNLVPLGLGTTEIAVSVPGADTSTRLRISWRGLWRSLW